MSSATDRPIVEEFGLRQSAGTVVVMRLSAGSTAKLLEPCTTERHTELIFEATAKTQMDNLDKDDFSFSTATSRSRNTVSITCLSVR